MTPKHIVSIDQALDLALRRLARAQHIVPNVLAGLDERRAQAANRERPKAEVLVQSSGTSDPTAAMATEIAAVTVHRQHIANAARLILRSLDHLDDCCKDALGRYRDDPDAPTCVGYPEGRECWDLPGVDFRGGAAATRANRLCDRCEMERAADERRAEEARRKRVTQRVARLAG